MVYLDFSATTPVCEKALEKMNEIYRDNFGNPSSTHCVGLKAREVLEGARKIIAEKLGAGSDEIYFTSGGTEANNLAVFGTVETAKKYRNKKRIVVSAIEHSSVFEGAKKLANEGYDVIFLKPDRHGNISPSALAEAIDENTILVSIMYVNNELGSILPVKSVKTIIKAKNSPALFHCDCVQAFCKKKFTCNSIGADLISVTAHKVFGPQGIGALYVRSGVKILPRSFGGEQEKKLRTGTQAVALAAGFAEAVKDFNGEKYAKKVEEINRYARSELEKIEGIVFNSDENASDYILNFSLPGYRSETMLNYLSEREICVSSGSACAKGKLSHVMSAVTDDKKLSDSAIRISFSHLNTKSDINEFISALKSAKEELIKS